MFSYDCMRILLMMLDCAVVHSTATWVSNSLKGHPLVCNLGLQSFKGTYLATVLQSWFIGVRFFKAEICPGSHSLRGYQWSLKDSGVRVGARIARGIIYIYIFIYLTIYRTSWKLMSDPTITGPILLITYVGTTRIGISISE